MPNPFDQFDGPAAPRPAPIGARSIPGTGPKPDKPNLPIGYRMTEGGTAEAIPGVPIKQDSEPETFATLSPSEAKTLGLAPGKVYQRGTKGSIKAVGDAAAPAGAGGDAEARMKLMETIAKLGSLARDANDNGGWFETGATGHFARSVLPTGTAGFDLNTDLNNIRSKFAFDALQAMRDASKTGGALGSITERELALLEASVANLDPDQSNDNFLTNVESARQAYLAKLAMVDPQLATRMGYDSKKAEDALLSLNDAYNREFGLQEPAPTIDRSANPGAMENPADIDAIMAKYGAK